MRNYWLERKEPKFDCVLSDKEILTKRMNYTEEQAQELIEGSHRQHCYHVLHSLLKVHEKLTR